jgi:hypothetical protein
VALGEADAVLDVHRFDAAERCKVAENVDHRDARGVCN